MIDSSQAAASTASNIQGSSSSEGVHTWIFEITLAACSSIVHRSPSSLDLGVVLSLSACPASAATISAAGLVATSLCAARLPLKSAGKLIIVFSTGRSQCEGSCPHAFCKEATAACAVLSKVRRCTAERSWAPAHCAGQLRGERAPIPFAASDSAAGSATATPRGEHCVCSAIVAHVKESARGNHMRFLGVGLAAPRRSLEGGVNRRSSFSPRHAGESPDVVPSAAFVSRPEAMPVSTLSSFNGFTLPLGGCSGPGSRHEGPGSLRAPVAAWLDASM